MAETTLTFQCGRLNLEGRLHLPEGDRGQIPGVVVCHPHPLFGGSMHNNVVSGICDALNAAGIAALRFNFRGVGASEGSFDNGLGEQDDLRAALVALAARPEVDVGRLGLVGYSFGGMVALAVGSWEAKVKALAAVSPVLAPGVLRGVDKPVLLISGSHDHVVTPQALRREAAGMALPGKVIIVEGVDHFWWGLEADLGAQIAAFFTGIKSHYKF